MTGHTHTCNDLTFEYIVHSITGNGNQADLLKLDLKIREITSGEFIFWRVLGSWNHCASLLRSTSSSTRTSNGAAYFHSKGAPRFTHYSFWQHFSGKLANYLVNSENLFNLSLIDVKFWQERFFGHSIGPTCFNGWGHLQICTEFSDWFSDTQKFESLQTFFKQSVSNYLLM